jgi:hypothetical protein
MSRSFQTFLAGALVAVTTASIAGQALALNPQPLPPRIIPIHVALNPQPLPPGIYPGPVIHGPTQPQGPVQPK